MIVLTKEQFMELRERLLHPVLPPPIDDRIKLEMKGQDIEVDIPLDLSFIK